MDRTYVKDLPLKVGQDVMVQGFVEKIRDQKHVQFVVLSDTSGQVQIVAEKTPLKKHLNDEISALTPGSTVTFQGSLVAAPKTKLGGIEIQAQQMETHSLAKTPLPISADSSPELCLDFRHVSLRRPEQQLIFGVQTTLEAAMYDFWKQEGFTIMHTPKLMGTASESGAELFSVDYFGRKAFLAQSPQFYKQMAIAGGVEKFAEIGPIFRADPSATSRHNSEFIGVDMEVAWVKSHEDIMALEEHLIAHTFKRVVAAHGRDITRFFGTTLEVPTTPFPRYPLSEIKDILATKHNHKLGSKDDLDPAAERLMAAYVKEMRGHEFFFATDYPSAVRAFYHMRYPEQPDTTKSFDLMYKGLEITTGAQREHRLDILQQQAVERGINPKELEGYFGFFAHGVPPHGGCGIGLGRLLASMLGQTGVSAVTLLPRTMTRLTP